MESTTRDLPNPGGSSSWMLHCFYSRPEWKKGEQLAKLDRALFFQLGPGRLAPEKASKKSIR
jgi:hypothetical protein